MSAMVEVEIDEFSDYEVLEAALSIIAHMKPDDLAKDTQVAALRRTLSAWPVDDEALLPPPSTAAKIATLAELAAWQVRERGARKEG